MSCSRCVRLYSVRRDFGWPLPLAPRGLHVLEQVLDHARRQDVAASGDRDVDRLSQVFGGRVLQQVAGGAVGQGALHVRRVLVGRQHDDRDVRPLELHGAQQLQARPGPASGRRRAPDRRPCSASRRAPRWRPRPPRRQRRGTLPSRHRSCHGAPARGHPRSRSSSFLSSPSDGKERDHAGPAPGRRSDLQGSIDILGADPHHAEPEVRIAVLGVPDASTAVLDRDPHPRLSGSTLHGDVGRSRVLRGVRERFREHGVRRLREPQAAPRPRRRRSSRGRADPTARAARR